MRKAAARTNDAARAMDALRRIVRALHSANATSQRDMKVTAAQLFVLRQIAAQPGMSLSDLAEHTRSAQSSVSEVVTRLTESGFVERRVSEEDGRRAELVLTRRGAAVARRAGETVQEKLVAAFESLERQEQQTLAGLMESWLVAAGLGETPATFFFSAQR